MSFDVFTARRRLGDLASAVYEPVFYNVMDRILDQNQWKSYIDDVNGKTLTFASIDEFLTSEDGLAIRDLGLFQRCMQAVASSPAPIAQLALRLMTRLQKEAGMSPALPEVADLPKNGAVGNGRSFDNIKATDGGTSQSYLLRRLKRDAPQLFDQLEAGAIRSVRAAAIEAGIVKNVPTVRLVSDINVIAAKLCQHLTPEQRHALAEALLQ